MSENAKINDLGFALSPERWEAAMPGLWKANMSEDEGNKKIRPREGADWLRELANADIGSAKFTAIPRIAFHIESNLLTLGKSFKSVGNNAGKMHKYIFPAVVVGNKPKTFIFVEPFNSTVIHNCTS